MPLAAYAAISMQNESRLLQSALFLALALLAPARAGADALVRTNAMNASTIAEYFVTEDAIRVDLEIGGRDLEAFRNLLPNDVYEKLGNDPRPMALRLREFFERDFAIAPDGAEPLFGRILEMGPRERVTRDDITGEPLVREGEAPDMVVFARIEYPLSRPPETLTLAAPAVAGVGFVLYHEGVAVNDFRYLGRGLTLALDWLDPWYSAFEGRSLRRQYFSPMSGFLYVEPYEVRKEIVARPLDLQHWVDLGLEGRRTIPVEMQPELLRKAGEFLRAHHPVTIDGQVIEPDLARINFLERTLRTSLVIDPPREIDVYSAMLGAIFVYPTVGLPEHVVMEWDLWSERLTRIPASAVDQAGPLPSFLEPDWRMLEWRNFLKNPVLPTLTDIAAPPGGAARVARVVTWPLLAAFLAALWWTRRAPRRRAPWAAALLVAAVASFALGREAALSDTRGRDVVQGLLHNVYRAFDFRGEEQIYDVLAQSVAGDLLEQIYLETRRSLVLANQGGARAKVAQVELMALEGLRGEDAGFRAAATWNVAGSVGHWGHVHERRNQVRADLFVAPVAGSWKLVDLTVLDEQRL